MKLLNLTNDNHLQAAATATEPSAKPVFTSWQQAKAAFDIVYQKLCKFLDSTTAHNTAAQTEPGRSAYNAWKLLKAEEDKAKGAPQKVYHTPPPDPAPQKQHIYNSKPQAIAAFTNEVNRFQLAGHSSNESWRLASITEPGRTAAASWAEFANIEKATAGPVLRVEDIANERIRDRSQQFQRLLSERAQKFPNESYDQRFSAVCDSEQGRPLVLVQMRRKH